MTGTLIDIIKTRQERDEALEVVSQLLEDKTALLEHIDDLYLRIDELTNQVERTRYQTISMAYKLGGPSA